MLNYLQQSGLAKYIIPLFSRFVLHEVADKFRSGLFIGKLAMETITNLLVEDDENDVFFMRRAIQKSNLNLSMQVATDGQSAIDYLDGSGAYNESIARSIRCHRRCSWI